MSILDQPASDSHIISCYYRYFNAKSLNNKLSTLHSLLEGVLLDHSFNMMYVNETWLCPDCPNSLLLNGNYYSIIRHDRNDSHGGGVCLFCNYSINCIQVTLPSHLSYLELLCVNLFYYNHKQRFILVYCLPTISCAYINDLRTFLDLLCDIDYVYTIVGNFNMPDILWSDLSTYPARLSSFGNFGINNGLHQLVYNPIRSENILDLLLTNDNLAFINVTVLAPFSTLDQSSISWYTWFPAVTKPINLTDLSISSFNFAKANYEGRSSYLLTLDWVQIFFSINPINVESLWLICKQILFNAINTCFDQTNSY